MVVYRLEKSQDEISLYGNLFSAPVNCSNKVLELDDIQNLYTPEVASICLQ